MIIPRKVVSLASKVGGKGLTKVQKFSPEILTAVGVIGFVGTAVLAAKATLKLEDTIDKITYEREEVKLNGGSKADLSKVYIRGSFELAKLYLPTISVGVLSGVAIISAHGIMTKRQAGLVAAYAVLERGFNEYRARVIEEYGEEKDREFQSGLKYKTTTKDGETKREATEFLRNDLTEYQRLFSPQNINFSQNPDFNVFFLTAQQSVLNDKLHNRGHLFLNEALEALGFEHTPAGAVVGWVRDSENGDGFVDFGADKWENIVYGAHYDGTEGTILLEFNVDGPIWDKI